MRSTADRPTRRKILVIGPSWVGDMVMAQSLYKLLHSDGSAIDVVAPPWSLPLLRRMPEVASGVELAAGHGELGLGKRWRLGRALHHHAYDQAIVLPRSFKAALVPFFASIPRRTGFLGEFRHGLINDVRSFNAERLDQTVKRFVALGGPTDDLPANIPFPELATTSEGRAAIASRLGLEPGRDVVALIPGAEYGSAKRWPVEYYAELAARLAAAGKRVWILGSAKEASLGATVAGGGANGRIRNLCGETELEEVVDLLACAPVAVTNDSGLMHVAAAVGTHVVALYGSSSPAFTPALTGHKSTLYLGIACSPCFERTCPLGHFRCMRDITVSEVYATVMDVQQVES